MARKIKDTPVLTSKAAERFWEAMKDPKPVPSEALQRALKVYERVMKKRYLYMDGNPDLDWDELLKIKQVKRL